MIVIKFVAELQGLIKDKTVNITVSPLAMDLLITQGFDPKMGARPLSRIIDNKIKKPLSREMLFGRLKNGGNVVVDVQDRDVILTI